MCKLLSFLCAAKGNWRNSIYIECEGCHNANRNPCNGYLLVPDSDGQPVVIPAGAVYSMTGLSADKDECRAVIHRRDFEMLYARWLEWNVTTSKECALLQIAGQRNCRRDSKRHSCCYQKTRTPNTY